MAVIPENTSIILFDGICNFCNYWVNQILRQDKKNRYRFASLQSEAGKKILALHKINVEYTDSVILIEDNKVYTQSTAVLKICKHLQGIYVLAYAFIVIPKFIRDNVYDLIAKNRYRWFGKAESCMIPTEEMKAKFIE
jgi:predicted DCC family thiol-disulfide oxidoreductase YuxK